MLTCERVTVTFGAVRAVADVSFEIGDREFVGLIGPNGAGKTTLINAVSGLVPVRSGDVRLGERSIVRLASWRRSRLGIARTFQNLRIFPSLSVYDNVVVATYGRTAGRRPARTSDGADGAAALLEKVGLWERRDVPAADLPYADRRRLAVARALVLRPQLLLLDEPMAGMNSAERAAFMDTLRDLKAREMTTVLIEHDLQAILEVTERVLVMDRGSVIADASPARIRRDPSVIRAYTGGSEGVEDAARG